MRNTNWYLVGGILACILGIVLYLMKQPDFMNNAGGQAAQTSEADVATSMDTDDGYPEEGGMGEEETDVSTDDDADVLSEMDVEDNDVDDYGAEEEEEVE